MVNIQPDKTYLNMPLPSIFYIITVGTKDNSNGRENWI